MFVVCFGQGLGNQMFQYAFYLALKKHYVNADIKMEIDHFLGKAHNGFELDKIFDVDRDEVNVLKILRFANRYPIEMPFSFILRLVWRLKRGIIGNSEEHIRYSEGTPFYPSVFKLDEHKTYILEGFWTNEKYFMSIKDDVIRAFQFKNSLEGYNIEIAKKIQETNSVSIHVRHGDYAKSNFYILPLEYYKEAIKILENEMNDLNYFIFSDDIDYIKENFGFLNKYEIVSENKEEKSYIDMQLMSLCKHNIIANSSFSFWGAYLNQYENKKVVAANKISPYNQGGFYCEDWHVIDIEPYYQD